MAWLVHARRGLSLAAVLGAWVSASLVLRLHPVSGLARWQARALAASALLVLLLGALHGIAADVPERGWRRLFRGVERVWLAALPLTALPWCTDRDVSFGVIALSAVLAAVQAPAGAWSRLGEQRGWRLALLCTAGILAVGFVAVGHSLAGSTNNDAAYYFGMARHLAQTQRWTEPIVWQFLSRPSSLAHAPFDYWHGLTSLFVAPFLALFGATHRVAGTVMGATSGLSLLLFAYLIAIAAPLRNAALQLLSLLLFAFSPALALYRFDVETLPLVHVAALVALIALAERRLALATAAACLAFVSRADAAMVAALLCGFAAYFALQAPAPRSALARVALTAALLALAYVGYHLATFGTLGPPGALLASRLMDGNDLYRWLASPATWSLRQRLEPDFIAGRVQVALETLQRAGFFPLYPMWLGCALFGAEPGPSQRRGIDAVTRCVLFAGAAGIALASPAVFAWWRSLHVLLPFFVAAGAYGADRLLSALPCVAPSLDRTRLGRVATALVTAGFALTLLRPLQLGIAQPPTPDFARDLSALDATFGGEPVMTTRPWYVLAYTHAPTVTLPFNGEKAMAEVVRRYGVRWLVTIDGEGAYDSNPVLNALRAGTREDIQGIPVHLQEKTATLAVFRIDQPPLSSPCSSANCTISARDLSPSLSATRAR